MRLKSLTLVGFKSFADKTTFEFHEGVTCVVGPNGCGKSNVVDAFKWVLGEQSAKSLRGGEMLDVIFNGTSQRRSAGYAEVSVTFEDAAGVLPDSAAGKEAAEARKEDRTIAISRRLYRSGESEYRINKELARLKDIREMFMDTGVGADAYSLIEQGRVEAFLQANAADRRALFDEAAGISRYKARRREALRRLERVEQNLLRLTDILGEVQKRLRSIKYQAGKARNYQAYSERLKELRSLFSLAEYHRLSGERRAGQARADELTDALSRLSARADRLEASRSAAETEVADLEAQARALDGQISELNAQLAACRQREQMLAARATELADSIATDAARREQLEARIESYEAQVQGHRQRLEALTGQLEDLAQREAALREESAREAQQLAQLRGSLEDEKNGTVDLLRRTAQLHNEINTHGLRRDNLHTQRQRLAGRSEEISGSLENLFARRSGEQGRLDQIRAVLSDSQSRLDATHVRQGELEAEEDRLEGRISRARQDYSALRSRQGVLEEMQRRYEGLGEGVRRALAAVAEGKLPFVRGVLGDFLETDLAHAEVIEAALGGAEQRLVADRLDDVLESAPKLRELLAGGGGVELICLDRIAGRGDDPRPEPVPGAIARASEWVRRDGSLAAVVDALLGGTLVVESLCRARMIAAADARPWRFVTLAGEVLEADGRVRIGSGAAPAGIISRRSELAELAGRLVESQRAIDLLEARRREVRAERDHQAEVAKALRTAVYEANAERVEHETVLDGLVEQIAELEKEAPLVAEEVRQLAAEIDAAVRAQGEAKDQADQLEQLRRKRESEIARLTEAIAEASRRVESVAAERTAAQVRLAEARQKRDGLSETLAHVASAAEGARQELAELAAQIEQARQRRVAAEQGAAEAHQSQKDLSERKAALVAEGEELGESRRSLAARLEEVRKELIEQRRRHEELAAAAGEQRVQLGEVEVRIETLIARTSEELGMDLPALYGGYQHDDQRDWEAVKTEIADLRSKIERLGNVNLDAIAEQDELQKRDEFLTGQMEDVRSSQRQLAELIRKINMESRRRFEESFQAVRSHFNELFRKLFGGGKADIVLTDSEDVLESGIEIVARPPGKELRSLSLLSGGEKTMTALSLMFSFFKARPSPFCLLDEVDAALDEANTQRFVLLVREFLGLSQFVVISHAKRTIAMADQIYGVTMQTPGVSTRIAVRFEDAAEMAEQPTEAVGA